MDTVSIIQGLEQLQNLRGYLSNIILDDYLSNSLIQGDAETKLLVQHFLDTGRRSHLTSIGIIETVKSLKGTKK